MTIVEEDVSTAYAAPGQPGALANYRPRYGHYIGGEFVDPVRGQYFENVSPVNGKPFCPAHLDRAIDSTFTYLEKEAGEVRAKVVRPTPRSAPTDDPDLMLIFCSATNRRAAISLARELSGDSHSRLNRWKVAARLRSKEARERAQESSGGAVDALIEQHIAWRRVSMAMHDAVQEIADEKAAR